MDILDFLGLNEAEHWSVFDDNSALLHIYETVDAIYELYALYDFFVELTFAPDSTHLLAVNPFRAGPRLEKYLDEFELSLSY